MIRTVCTDTALALFTAAIPPGYVLALTGLLIEMGLAAPDGRPATITRIDQVNRFLFFRQSGAVHAGMPRTRSRSMISAATFIGAGMAVFFAGVFWLALSADIHQLEAL
jgi:hypothetical protein